MQKVTIRAASPLVGLKAQLIIALAAMLTVYYQLQLSFFF